MKARVAALLVVSLPCFAAQAGGWAFAPPVSVTVSSSAGLFHHLDGSGRRHVAADNRGVAVAWEDDRDGTPRVYVAYKGHERGAFGDGQRVSGEGEAFEPSLVALGDGRFVVAWEEEGQVMARLLRLGAEAGMGSAQRVSRRQGAQASLTSDGRTTAVLWAEHEQGFDRIRARRLVARDLELVPQDDCPVDAAPPTDAQLYPAATLLNGRLVAVWEDRRPKHTIIMAGLESRPGSCEFGPPARISEKPSSRNLPYGAGHGVSRVAIDRLGGDEAFAAWADKRDFRNGYDIWGAFLRGGETAFGANVRVQDDFGGLSKQRHASVGGGPDGRLVVAWDDEREGSADLMLSGWEGESWSEDWPVPVASGAGEQTHPSLVFDEAGRLHLVWIERDEPGGATRLRYSVGHPDAD